MTKTSLKLRKHKTINYAIYILLKDVKILIKILFNFSSYNLNDHEKSVLCKGLKTHLKFLLPFEMLFGESTDLDIGNFNKECVRSRFQDSDYSLFKQVSKISDKNLPI